MKYNPKRMNYFLPRPTPRRRRQLLGKRAGVMLALISHARCRGCGDESCWNCFATPPLAQYCFTLSSHDHGLIASQQRGSNTAAHAALRMFHKRASIQIESYA